MKLHKKRLIASALIGVGLLLVMLNLQGPINVFGSPLKNLGMVEFRSDRSLNKEYCGERLYISLHLSPEPDYCLKGFPLAAIAERTVYSSGVERGHLVNPIRHMEATRTTKYEISFPGMLLNYAFWTAMTYLLMGIFLKNKSKVLPNALASAKTTIRTSATSPQADTFAKNGAQLIITSCLLFFPVLAFVSLRFVMVTKEETFGEFMLAIGAGVFSFVVAILVLKKSKSRTTLLEKCNFVLAILVLIPVALAAGLALILLFGFLSM